MWLSGSVHRSSSTGRKRRRRADQEVAAGATVSQMKNEVAWAGQHLADGFVAGHSWGEWQADLIKDLQNKINEWTGGNINDVHVATVRSNTAVAHHPFRSPEIAPLFCPVLCARGAVNAGLQTVVRYSPLFNKQPWWTDCAVHSFPEDSATNLS